jgi:hypothetical protein
MLTEETVIDRIDIDEGGVIGVRRASFILRDGVRLQPSFHRTTYPPGADVSHEDPRVQAIAGVIWTEDVKAKYDATLAAAAAALGIPAGAAQP